MRQSAPTRLCRQPRAASCPQPRTAPVRDPLAQSPCRRWATACAWEGASSPKRLSKCLLSTRTSERRAPLPRCLHGVSSFGGKTPVPYGRNRNSGHTRRLAWQRVPGREGQVRGPRRRFWAGADWAPADRASPTARPPRAALGQRAAPGTALWGPEALREPYLARAVPGGSMRLCHLEESVSSPGRMWPSRTRVTCCMSRQKME